MWKCPCPDCGLWFGSLEALQKHLGTKKREAKQNER